MALRFIATGAVLSLLYAAHAYAQIQVPPPGPRALEPAQPLSLPRNQPKVHGMTKGTAFFVDGAGHMLTARHAVENCSSVVVTKEKWRMSARVVSVSARYDLALLKVKRTLGLSAVFPRTAGPRSNDIMFAGSYDTLPDMMSRRGVLANSRVAEAPGEPGHLALESMVSPGASGAPVLDGKGLVQGIISRRAGTNRVIAVGATEAKAFLASSGVRIDSDDRPQIAGGASRAHRAASLSARVTCLR